MLRTSPASPAGQARHRGQLRAARPALTFSGWINWRRASLAGVARWHGRTALTRVAGWRAVVAVVLCGKVARSSATKLHDELKQKHGWKYSLKFQFVQVTAYLGRYGKKIVAARGSNIHSWLIFKIAHPCRRFHSTLLSALWRWRHLLVAPYTTEL